jgi:uncharacterized protein
MSTHFLVLAYDADDAGERRIASREAHLQRIAAEKAAGNIHVGGPLFDETGTTMNGSFLVLAFADRQAVEAWMADDIYVTNRVWAHWTIAPCNVAPLFLS